MRVFIGIKTSEEIQKRILAWQEKHKNLPVRFIKPENLHITLVPPWYETKINDLVKYLSSFKSLIRNFEIRFDSISLGPSIAPRLFWAEAQTPRDLLELRKNINVHLKKKPEKRPFKTHITLARFKHLNFEKLKDEQIERNISWEMTVGKITLFESKLSPLGANYREISSFQFPFAS
ncbi:MAG: 2'-5' RNA ligase [Candidatus Levybacteria bacterium RIFCSPHIGHO2_02_FULL_40_18]|nr:MAG: 2'-5' RNA ligase [Candidatus Levybacteria bacterium RIFCSPHIGHO2_01_FULL_40_58]OGH26318.1 MAG: 2'-5' RNA ligase [Candidatus Levybacteria bacterium RIFCSPHIGHO2_02_FULL_40_18]OGH31277.1 MAG: 2'-5' RNA ligase [Candidatus Levybacteria bacterium RIFCSPHIGHO2_12_FULL_40_31]OGH40347.1 MAG: 2'-5' RNA ligase [Candidatus Levybacteria bacterium RIFCSPLOWO2_01_FULL_40_64]OGH49226.1 MAG: 2'-5' RNA ligase [Candidatus Levybacteria bacterium RIFCSPLOWO2_02_FULL_41_11]OGH53585.1 MAG: 2'-5' RNA ligase 